ncbi:hypothetical protein C0Q70_06028 [Pomacea canaliculata]|uniref:Uncharacterized protein n=1 Tax=Pomacea canaliculata TaxID=400727 RepID=A0A2T7PMV3_POMCA|nr:hypothetical protein C0Q70_06028 [Pomacea canaliculata]
MIERLESLFVNARTNGVEPTGRFFCRYPWEAGGYQPQQHHPASTELVLVAKRVWEGEKPSQARPALGAANTPRTSMSAPLTPGGAAYVEVVVAAVCHDCLSLALCEVLNAGLLIPQRTIKVSGQLPPPQEIRQMQPPSLTPTYPGPCVVEHRAICFKKQSGKRVYDLTSQSSSLTPQPQRVISDLRCRRQV